MQYRVHRVSDVSRNAFQNLLALWLTIVFLTVAAALLLSAGTAKADVLMTLPKLQLVYEPAVLRSFSPSPTPALIQEQCQNHLLPHTHGLAQSDIPSRTQRNAETKGLQTIMAIKAYRQCVSQIVLKQLASK